MSYAPDSTGKTVFVAWSDMEMEYIHALSTLTVKERWLAIDDVASITGRRFSTIKAKVEAVIAEKRKTAREFLAVNMRKDWQSEHGPYDGSRRLFVSVPTLSRQQHNMPPSALRAVSEAAKMGGSARSVKSAPD